MSSIYGKGPKAKASKLHSQLVRLYGECQRCGDMRGPFEAAHIIRRSHVGNPDGISLRTNVDNAWCLCRSCHRRTEDYPDDFMELVRRTIGEVLYSEFKRLSYAPHRPWRDADWLREVERLQSILDEIPA